MPKNLDKDMYYYCVCGCQVLKTSHLKHLESKKHQKLLNEKPIPNQEFEIKVRVNIADTTNAIMSSIKKHILKEVLHLV